MFSPDDVSSPPCPSGPVPYPTLYNGISGHEPQRPKSIIEVLIYNIGRQLASVAAGYDVGLSNVMPYNPNMVSEARRTDTEDAEERTRLPWYDNPGSRGAGPVLYPHKTYHGHTPHHRTPLPGLAVTSGVEAKPLRFSDSPQPPGDAGDITQPPPPVATGPGLDRPLYVPPPDYNEPGPGYTMARTARYYQDQLESEREATGAGYSLYQDRQNYKESPGRGRVPEPHPLAYSNPNYESQQPRTPGRVTFGHRRTPSGSSSTGYRDPGYDQGPGSGPSSSEYSERHERPPPLVPRRLSRQGSYGNEVERPQTLELTRTPLRSSLKKHNYAYSSGGQSGGSGSGQTRNTNWSAGWGSGGGTPTNENSSSDEVAALCYPPSKSDSGFVSSGRLTGARFSPRAGEKVTDWSPTGGDMGGSAREIGAREYYTGRPRPQGSYSADSPGRRSHHPYADFIADNDLKKTGGYDY